MDGMGWDGMGSSKMNVKWRYKFGMGRVQLNKG